MLMTMEEKERKAEMEFKKWLDKQELPYFYIQQDPKSFSSTLKKYFGKRPDFFVLLPLLGFILTDVKYKKPADKYEEFQINADETGKYIKLEERFNLKVWFVFSNENVHFKTWYWIPVRRVKDVGKVFTAKIRQGGTEEYYGVPVSDFIQISDNESIDKLFSGIVKLP